MTVLMACSESPTTSNVDATADFNSYKTYAFLADLAEDQKSYQSLQTTYLKNAVGREMKRRGFSKDNQEPQLVIAFAVETQDKVRTRQVPSTSYGIGYDPYYDTYYDGWGTTHTTRIDQYTEGKLNIDAIEVSSRRLVWQGSTKGRITTKDEKRWEQTLTEAVHEIFTGFPIPGPE